MKMMLFQSFWLNIAVIVICLMVTFLYFSWTSTFNYWKNKGVVFKKPIPLFGNLKKVLLMQQWIGLGIQEIYKQYPKELFVGIFYSSKPGLLLRDPDLIRQIMIKDFQYFQDRLSTNREAVKEPFQVNLINLHGDKWKQLRNKLTPSFTSGKLKTMFPLLVECSVNLESLLCKMADSNESFEMKELCEQYITHVIGSVVFGIEINSLRDPNSKFIKIATKVNVINTQHFYLRALFPKLMKYLKLRATPKDLEELYVGVFKEVIDNRRKNNTKRNDFMQLLIELQDEESIDRQNKTDNTLVFSDAVLAAQAIIFFKAGFGTSSATISVILYELALNPDIQKKVQHEIDEVLQKHNGNFTYDAVHELKYLIQVISEGLRKYPPFGHAGRVCTSPYILPGTNVKLDIGDAVHFSIYGLHHDPIYFPNPSKFDPERFSEDGKTKIHPFSYLPFGGGPRMCIGFRFARLQTVSVLAFILKKFSVRCCVKTDIPLKFDSSSLMLKSTNGIWLNVVHRNN